MRFAKWKHIKTLGMVLPATLLLIIGFHGKVFASYTNSLGQTFVLIPSGTFTMGSSSSEPGRQSDEGPRHQVTLTKGFYMQATEVTQAQWEADGLGSGQDKALIIQI